MPSYPATGEQPIFAAAMKKLAQICLLVIYTAAALGVSVKGLYCCDKLRSVSISFAGANDKSEEDASCYKTKQHVLQVKDDHLATETPNAPTFFTGDIVSFVYPALQCMRPQHPAFFTYQSHGPPLAQGVPLYLFDGVFRI